MVRTLSTQLQMMQGLLGCKVDLNELLMVYTMVKFHFHAGGEIAKNRRQMLKHVVSQNLFWQTLFLLR